jgi:hypothetical protein
MGCEGFVSPDDEGAAAGVDDDIVGFDMVGFVV